MSYSELTRRFASGNGAVFVGAGLSMGAGLPSWAKLVEPLRDALKGLPERQSFTPEQIAGWYEITAGRRALVDFLTKQLNGAKPGNCHRLLDSLPVDLFLTTNFDDLLERSLADADVIVNDIDFSALDDPSRRQLIKIHGDFRDAGSIVFTRADYDHYLENRPAIAETIRLTLMRRTVLFIGYSFNDRNLTTILGQVGRRLGKLQRPLFTLLFNPNEYVVKELEQKYGVAVVPLEVGPGQDASYALQLWLEKFKSDIEHEQVLCAAKKSSVPVSNLPAHCACFVGREKDIAEVIRALRTSRIVGIEGFPGSGKTALAIEVAKRCEYARKSELKRDDLLFAHCLYVDASGMNDETLLNQVLDKVADLFKMEALKQIDKPQIERKKEQIAVMLRIFPVLIIIDQLKAEITGELSTWIDDIPAPSAVLLVSQTRSRNAGIRIPISGLKGHEARDFLRDQLKEHSLVLDEETIGGLIQMVDGNPQGMKMLVGQMARGALLSAALDAPGVLDNSWNLLSKHGKRILLAASIFATDSISEDGLREAVDLPDDREFSSALKECQDLMLLEPCTKPKPVSHHIEGYALHPMTAHLARKTLDENPDTRQVLYKRLANYYLEFVRRSVVRPAPDVPYWNALATQGMFDIDDEWQTIQRLMDWTAQHDRDLLVEMVFLLVHYLDTRLLNSDRLKYVHAAIDTLQASRRNADEALLRIDALGWTLVEEGRLTEAEQEIRRGLALAEGLTGTENADLIPLAYVGLARVQCAQENTAEAQTFIEVAIERSSGASAWISYRVHMISGDIAVRRRKYGSAINSYEACSRLVASYGGEEGYQILPRLGLTYLVSGKPAEARKALSELLRLSRSDHIDVATLYAEYGLAVLDFKSNRVGGNVAANRIEQLHARVAQMASDSFLRWLMDKVCRELVSRHARGTRRPRPDPEWGWNQIAPPRKPPSARAMQ